MRKPIIAIFDDRDGKPLQEGEIVSRDLTLDGRPFKLDLRAETSQMLDAALAPFLSGATSEIGYPAPLEQSAEEAAEAAPALTEETVSKLSALLPSSAASAPVAPAKSKPPMWVCNKCGDTTATSSGMAGHLFQKHGKRGGVASLAHLEGEAYEPIPEDAPEPAGLTPGTRKQFGIQIRKAREARYMSQRQLAEAVMARYPKVNMGQSDVSKVERGAAMWRSRLQAVSSVLELSMPKFEDPVVTPKPKPEAEQVPEPEPEKVFPCREPGCDFSSNKSHLTKGHERFKHGLGGESAAQILAKRQAESAERRKERIRASVLDPLREEEGRAAPEPDEALPERVKPLHTIVPGVNVVASPPRSNGFTPPRPAPPQRELTARGPQKSFADTTIEVTEKVHEYADKFKDGVPEDIMFSTHDDVLRMKHYNATTTAEALRNPEWVEVAAKSYVKGYPILLFHLADTTVVLGLRNPTDPRVIAVYNKASLEEDLEKVNHGGAEVRDVPEGLPRTADEMLARFRAAGAEVEYDELSGDTAVPVTYRGQDLGKVPVGNVARPDVEIAYQRVIRKISAINTRELEPVG